MSETPTPEQLGKLADTALERMTPEQRQLYSDIVAIRDSFGSVVDVNALVRAVRKELLGE